MGKLDPGSRVVCQKQGKAQLGTVMSVTEAGEDFSDFRTSRTLTSPDGLIFIVQLDDGSLVPVPERMLSAADESRPNQVHFTPAATMTRTEGGWILEVDFSSSVQGGTLAGVIVDDGQNIPEGEAACEALNAAIKRSPSYRNGAIQVLISDT